MSLTLVLGRAGSGKTTYITQQIQQIAQKALPALLLVPDQYTVAAEKYLLDQLGEAFCRPVRILSLKRLASTLASQYASVSAPPLGEGGKAVLLKKAVDAVSDQFRYYPPSYREFSFVRTLQSTFKELKAGGTSADALTEIARIENNDRLYDLSLIYQAYESFLAGEFSDPDDSLSALCGLLKTTGLFSGQAVFVDNFHGFYTEERNVLLQLCRNGAEVTVTLPAPSLKDEEMGWGLFSGPTEEAARLAGQAKRYGCQVQIVCLEGTRGEDKALRFLERNLFVPEAVPQPEVPKSIQIFQGADRFDEAERVAEEITRLVRDEGWHYRDFAIIVRSLDDYDGILDAVFFRYGIPLFFHRRTSLREKNPVPLLTSLFDILTGGYTPDAVMTFLKSGFGNYSVEDVSYFEHYIDRWSIRYNRFLQEFRQSIRGLTDQEQDRDRLRLEQINRLRKDFTERIESFRKATEGQDVRTVTAEVFAFLTAMNVEQTLDRMAEEYAAYGEADLAARQKEVYGLLLDALDELVAAAGNDRVSTGEYRDLLLAVLDARSIAILPTSLDQVLAGSPETMPLLSPAGVFILGLAEGMFPQVPSEHGILEDADRKILTRYGAYGGETAEEKILRERFYLYTSFASPRKKLYLSWPATAEGQTRPSEGILQVWKLFPALCTAILPSIEARIQNEAAAFLLTSSTPVSELEEYFRKHPQYGPLYGRRDTSPTPSRMERLRQRQPRLQPETALALFGESMDISASKADKYHLCPYAYFCRYGLKLHPLRRAELNPVETGTLIHAALEACMAPGMDCTDEELSIRVEAFGKNWLNRVWREQCPPDSFLSYFRALLQKIDRLLRYFRKELSASEFVPEGFEVRISDKGQVSPVKVPLQTGEIYLSGVVDRVDVLEKNGVRYLRVVDYKSGHKEFDLRKVQAGIDIQMLMYLCALKQNAFPGQPSVQPAGVMYVNANPAVVAVRRDEAQMAEIRWEEKEPRTGLYLNDPEILQAMDSTPERKYIRIRKDAHKALISQERFGELFEEIKTLLTRMGERLHQGQIPRSPVIGCGVDSCRYCDLRQTCVRPQSRPLSEKEE